MKLYMIVTYDLEPFVENIHDVLGVYSTKSTAEAEAARYEKRYPWRTADVEEIELNETLLDF